MVRIALNNNSTTTSTVCPFIAHSRTIANVRNLLAVQLFANLAAVVSIRFQGIRPDSSIPPDFLIDLSKQDHYLTCWLLRLPSSTTKEQLIPEIQRLWDHTCNFDATITEAVQIYSSRRAIEDQHSRGQIVLAAPLNTLARQADTEMLDANQVATQFETTMQSHEQPWNHYEEVVPQNAELISTGPSSHLSLPLDQDYPEPAAGCSSVTSLGDSLMPPLPHIDPKLVLHRPNHLPAQSDSGYGTSSSIDMANVAANMHQHQDQKRKDFRNSKPLLRYLLPKPRPPIQRATQA